MQTKATKPKKALVLFLAFAMVFTYMFTSGIGQKEDRRVYAADSGPNAQYSLAGAKYYVYTDSACTQRAEDASGSPAEFTTDASGNTSEIELEQGTYYVKEASAPKGYALDDTVYTVKVESGETITFETKDIPQSAPFQIQKIDIETGKPVPMGGATLAGAEFEVVYTDGGDITRTWIIKSGEDGIANLDDEHFVSGDERYKNSKGEYVVPLGKVTVKEIKAPEGYRLNENGTITITIGADGQKETTTNVTSSGEAGSVTLAGKDPVTVNVPDQVMRSDIEFNKIDGVTQHSLAGIAFVITSKTTGESHVVVTNSNGRATTIAKKVAHGLNTNGNDAVVDSKGNAILSSNDMIDESNLNWKTGIWFYTDKEGNEATAIDENKGALPYDTYLVTELPSSGNKGKEMIVDRPIVIDDELDKDIYYGYNWTNDPEIPKNPAMHKVRNEDASSNGKGQYGFQAGDFVTYDVTIKNPNKSGSVTMDVYDEFVEGAEYFSKPVVVNVSNAKQNKLSDDKNTVNITIDAGETAVVTFGALVKSTAKEYLADAAKDSDSEKSGEDANKRLRDNEPDENDGYRNIAYTTNVRYKPNDGTPGTDLDDDEDDAQTPVKEPKIGTTLADDAARKIVSGHPATLVDTVKYEGLTPGKTYVIEGTLMVKDSGDPLVENGKAVTAKSDEFVPTSADGEVTVTFTVDTKVAEGKELVAFETAYVVKDENGNNPKNDDGKETEKTEVAKHEDIDDEAQTVEVPGYEMYKVRNEAATAKGNKYGFEAGTTVTYDVVIKNTSKTALIKMDVTDAFTEGADYFTTPEVVEVKNAEQNSISEDKNKVNITVEAGKTAVVTYAATIKEGAKEYLASAAKDSDSKDANGNDVNKANQANKTDDKDGYRNAAKVENPIPYDPNSPDDPLDPLTPKEDEAQTPVKEPEIGTYLADDANKKTIGPSATTTLIDTVAYKGLTKGETYAVVGELIVKEAGDPLVENGTPVKAVGTFTAEESDGSTEVTFVVNTKGLEGKHLVAFETAYNITGTEITKDSTPDEVEKVGKKVAEHKNLKDKAQTVLIKKPGSGPKTGDILPIGMVIAFVGAAVASLIAIRRKRKLQ